MFANKQTREMLIIALKIAVIEVVAEAFIMFAVLPPLQPYINELIENILDPLFLVTITAPLISMFVLKPYITQRERAEENLRTKEENLQELTRQLTESEERYILATNATDEGLWDWDLEDGTLFLSEKWKSMLDFSDQSFPSHIDSWLAQIHPQDKDMVKEALHTSSHQPRGTKHALEYRIYDARQNLRWVCMKWTCIKGKNENSRLVGAQAEITYAKEIESQLRHDALHDALTGLPNRALLQDRLSQALAAYKRSKEHSFALLFVDLDNFKRINDSLGHAAGDEFLKQVASRLSKAVRENDTVARLGGDEFAILLFDVSSERQVEILLMRIFQMFFDPIVLEEQELHAGLSIGVVLASNEYQVSHYGKMLSDADVALYKAKSAGKGNYAIFDVAMREKQLKLFKVSNALVGAVERGEMRLYYQPIVSMQDGEVVGFEALMRWESPQLGFVTPDVFIPLAEESSLIHALGLFALEEGVQQLNEWSHRFHRSDWTLNVNVSGKQLERDSFYKSIDRVLSHSHVKASQIVLEITESVIATFCEIRLKKLESLRQMGFKLSIDDFGTGNSSLSTFHRYPFDELKIDKSFVSSKDLPENAQSLVKAIQALADASGVRTIAEGIETPEQLDFLKALGCDHAQGFYFSPPLPALDMTLYLEINAARSKKSVRQAL